MVVPSFLAEICTPSSFWPEAEVIEPVSNWSAEAVVTAPTRTRLATLANNWPRICVMVIFSFSSVARRAHARRAVALVSSTNAEGGDALMLILFARIARASTWFSKSA